MKIIGLQGLDDPQSIRAEVERGGRFVVYIYCISIVVMTFKRTSDIHFIRPGQSAVVRGLPCTLVSFFLGWWGFPWGLVYTLEALVKNLGGGTDITHAMLAQIDPPALGAATAESENSARAATPATPPPMPLRGDAPPPSSAARPASTEPRSAVGLGLFRLAAFILAAGALGWIGVAVHRGANVRTALVNGLATPLTVTLDDDAHALAPNAAAMITLGEGEHRFSWTRPDGRVETDTFVLRTPFWTRPLHRIVAVFNPDRTALVYRETTRYFPDDQPIPDGQNDYELHAGQTFYSFPAADYFFEDFPAKISLTNREVVAKSRHAHADKMSAGQRLLALSADTHAEQSRALAFRLGDLHPDDEILSRYALARVQPADTDAFFALHLDDRPLRLEWHRTYQHHIEYNFPERDLFPRYRQLASESPDDGDAAYLAARIAPDAAARQAFLRQAATAARPSAYAHNSLAYEALADGDFPAALAHLRNAEKAGLDSLSFRQNQRDILLANQLTDEAIAHLHALRARAPDAFAPMNFPFLCQEVSIACQRAPSDPAAETALTAPYLQAIQPVYSPEDYVATSAQLAALAAYARGDEETYTIRLANSEDARFAVAITRGRAADAVKALADLPRVQGSSWLLVYLVAHSQGDTAAASSAFANSLAAFATESREHRAIAALLGDGEPDPAAIFEQVLPVDEKCVLATALGHRFPAHRAAYHALAAKLNFRPEFPSRFLARLLNTPGPASPAPSL